MEVSGRRRPTLSQHMSMVDSSTLRDGRNTLAGLTLAAVLSGDSHRHRSSTTRTLLDIIKEEQSSSATVYGGLVHPHHHNKKSWKAFKDRLRSRRDPSSSSSSAATTTTTSGAAAFAAVAHQVRQISTSSPPTTTTRTPTGDPIPVLIQPENPSEVNARAPVAAEFRPEPVVVMRLSAALEAEREEQRQQGQTIPETGAAAASAAEVETGNAVAPPSAAAAEGPRVSLMSLLEETERAQREVVAVGPTTAEDCKEEEDGKGEDDVADGGREGRGGQEYVCCVCMVRHKGAAFIPCGHTFCRVCSRELWVGRGNCPLCNGYILEILDIF